MALRAATAPSHKRVDAAFSKFTIANDAGYRAFLIAHDAVLPRCERDLAASGAVAWLGDWADRIRAPALRLDMADIGAEPAGPMPAVILLSPAEGFGMMYVLEGSRLGGAILARLVGTDPDTLSAGATRYLTHGDGLHLWPSFVAALDASAVVRDDPDAVIRSAVATFALFENAAAHNGAIA